LANQCFHRVTDASKITLVALVEHLRAQKFALLDTQWLTPHLQQFGGIEISRDNYLRLLRRAVELPCAAFEIRAAPARKWGAHLRQGCERHRGVLNR
jgi:Leu/Phe-tRNA-protein transferase